MSTTTALVVLGGVLVFAVAAYLIVQQIDKQSQFGDLLGLAGNIL